MRCLLLVYLVVASFASLALAVTTPDSGTSVSAIYASEGGGVILITWGVPGVSFNVIRNTTGVTSCAQVFQEAVAAQDCAVGSCASGLATTVCKITVSTQSGVVPSTSLTPKPNAVVYQNASGTYSLTAPFTVVAPVLFPTAFPKAVINVPNTVPSCATSFPFDGTGTKVWSSGPLQPTLRWDFVAIRLVSGSTNTSFTTLTGLFQAPATLANLTPSQVSVTLTVTDYLGYLDVTTTTVTVTVDPTVRVSAMVFGPSAIIQGRPALFLPSVVACSPLDLANANLNWKWSGFGLNVSAPVLSVGTAQTASVSVGETVNLFLFDGNTQIAAASFLSSVVADTTVAALRIVPGQGSSVTSAGRAFTVKALNLAGDEIPTSVAFPQIPPVWVRCKVSDTYTPSAPIAPAIANSCFAPTAGATPDAVTDLLPGTGIYRYTVLYEGLQTSLLVPYFSAVSAVSALQMKVSLLTLTSDSDWRAEVDVQFSDTVVGGGNIQLTWSATLDDNTTVSFPPGVPTNLPWLVLPQGSGFFRGTNNFIITLTATDSVGGSNVVSTVVSTQFDAPTLDVTCTYFAPGIIKLVESTNGLVNASFVSWKGSFPLGTLFNIVIKDPNSATGDEFALLPESPVPLIQLVYPTFFPPSYTLLARSRFPNGAISYRPVCTDVKTTTVSPTSTDYTDVLYSQFLANSATVSSGSSLFNLYSTLGYMCINGGNTLGSLNATAFADFMRLFFARKVYAVVSASSDQATFALMVRGLGTCAQRVAPANISAYAGVLDIFLNVLQFLANSTDWSLSTRPIVDLMSSLRVLQLVPTKQCKPDEAGRVRWRTYLTQFLRSTLLSRMQAMQCFEQFTLNVGGEATIFLYKVCGVEGAVQSVSGQVEWDLANDTAIPASGVWWLTFKTMPNPVLWDCSTTTRSLIHRGLFLDAAGNEFKYPGNYTLYLATPGNATTATPMCTFWDETNNVYSSAGCEYVGSAGGQYLCRCNHLTDFMVLTTSSDSSTGRLSNGAIAGIVLGSVVAISVVVVLIGYFAFYKRGRCYKREKSHSFR